MFCSSLPVPTLFWASQMKGKEGNYSCTVTVAGQGRYTAVYALTLPPAGATASLLHPADCRCDPPEVLLPVSWHHCYRGDGAERQVQAALGIGESEARENGTLQRERQTPKLN
ncbi:UNVERIFIED_CONTAM: hypothetical protein FKN15_004594 [Acipenser sinensis]